MRNLIRINDYSKDEVNEIFKIAEEIKNGKYIDFLKGKTIVMLFPNQAFERELHTRRGFICLGDNLFCFLLILLIKKKKSKML